MLSFSGTSGARTPASWGCWVLCRLQPTAGILNLCVLALITIFAIPLCALSSSAPEEQPKERNVLVLFSSVQYSLSFLDLIEPSMRARVPEPITFYDAYLEDPQVEEKSYRESVSETLRRRYAQVKLDVVIAINPAALHFAVEYRDKIFPGVPIVFAGVGAGDLENQKIWPGVTGVASPWGFRDTIDLMLRLQPDTTTVAVIAGETNWDKQFLAVAHSELLRHQDKVREIDIVGPPSHQLFERVAALPPHTVALFQAFPQFANQPEFGTWNLVAAVTQRLPTYSVFTRLCVEGCIGGAYEDVTKEDLWTAEIAARVLLGERPDNIPVAYATDLQIRVDWRALHRWQIPASALPPGSVVLNREPTLWEQYRKYVVAAIAVIALQLLLILGLLWQRAKRRKTEAELILSNDQLRLAMDSGKSVGWDLDVKSGQNTWFGDLQAVFGIPSTSYSESVEDFRHRLHPEDQEPVWKAFSDARQGQEPYAAEFRVLRADGTVRWLTARGKLYDPGRGDAVRMLGMAVDITEVKQAEEALSGMSRKLIEAHEEERTWIARELHDDINQRLALLAVNLETLSQKLPASRVEVKRRISKEQGLVSELGRDVQALSHRLHSSKLEYLGLVAAASGLCKELSDQQKVEIDFHSDGIPKNLPPEISLCLFRVMQEALQNGIKHSGSRHFEVRLGSALNEIQLRVCDSGVGFDLDQAMKGRGVGLSSMQERLKLVGGEFSIESQLQHGTTIQARVPLSPRMKAAATG